MNNKLEKRLQAIEEKLAQLLTQTLGRTWWCCTWWC